MSNLNIEARRILSITERDASVRGRDHSLPVARGQPGRRESRHPLKGQRSVASRTI